MPKIGKIRRRIKAAGKAVVHGAKVATGRQLSKRQMQFADDRRDKSYPRYWDIIFDPSHSLNDAKARKIWRRLPSGEILIEKWDFRTGKNTVREYTSTGELSRKTSSKPTGKPSGILKFGGAPRKEVERAYSPAGSFFGRRVKRNR
ncbi:MAG: hypothetical protein PHD95_07305 [Candidatus ainarchaeum sp.]|nr:hypothetical protein [Candidatus ainarchaeum sp.]